jgi:hypothetical protein
LVWKRNAVNGANNFADAGRRCANALHGVHHITNNFPTFLGNVRIATGHDGGFLGALS